ncbi:unnamed protein product [Trifolium pratense]|uniref:Uncharacterized protein n=1 Tax=Trifolium pratense TaxID=57577 RepID=A0ACB0K3R2_TRIPR|nr:unnamed protein product [Trifolium pratense]
MTGAFIQGVTYANVEIRGYSQTIYFYVVPMLEHPVILGEPWMRHNKAYPIPHLNIIRHEISGNDIPVLGSEIDTPIVQEIRSASLVTSLEFMSIINRLQNKMNVSTNIFKVSINDIDKALLKLSKQDHRSDNELRKLVPEQFHDLIDLWRFDKASKLPPNRPGIDHRIEIKADSKGNKLNIPFGPLYNMSREELLVLRKTLNDLLDKGYIRASKSEAGAPVLFVRKPGGGLRFCCDYRGLNTITNLDRYPLPLFNDTIRNLTSAKWFTKLDVVAAFHKIRMEQGEEWKTAFRTRYGLFEWLVTPFGLTGAPATFQRYINRILQSDLDDYCTAYMDDVLIYTTGDKKDHDTKVRKVLCKLLDAGLYLDPDKCEFAVKSVKYLGFIIRAGYGIQADPDKIKAIVEWEPPSSTTGVRSFVGFANYYRMFISSFSEIIAPLTALTGKGVPYKWEDAHQQAFETLKILFTRTPNLAQWDHKKATFLEADCSGFALGGALTQLDNEGKRRVVAYYSQKLTPAERNYPIHDKELLAIIRCLEQWDAELRSCSKFCILTDHRNLEYFMTRQKLSERQARWAEYLSRFSFQLIYRPGKEAVVPDALSRREQDKPNGMEVTESRTAQLIPDNALNQWLCHTFLHSTTTTFPPASRVFENDELHDLWTQTLQNDKIYQRVYEVISRDERALPAELQLKVQVSECSIDSLNRLLFRDRIWIPGAPPDGENNQLDALRTKLIQKTHDSSIVGHPGREGTISILSRDYYWPKMHKQVRRFLRNCHICGRTKVWREHKKGFLKPLPIPDRFYSDIAMDFITKMPPSETSFNRDKATNILVITDRLIKNVTLEALASIDAETVAERFMWCYYRYHGFPKSITSDQGPQWVGRFWKHLCKLVGIEQRLTSTYHPQTDGCTERWNQEVWAYLRSYVNYMQNDWAKWLFTAQVALNNRPNTTTGLSPFFVTHGYNLTPLDISRAEKTNLPEEKRASNFVSRLKDLEDFSQSALAAANQQQEFYANKKRSASERFQVGDKVWLSYEHYGTDRPKKKMDWLRGKYTVSKVLGSHNVELTGLPKNISNVFHVDQLRRVANDPLPAQELHDEQPPPIQTIGGEEQFVNEILCARTINRGKGKQRLVLVSWKGFADPTWEPLQALQETEALDNFEKLYGNAETNNGPLSSWPFGQIPRPALELDLGHHGVKAIRRAFKSQGYGRRISKRKEFSDTPEHRQSRREFAVAAIQWTRERLSQQMFSD